MLHILRVSSRSQLTPDLREQIKEHCYLAADAAPDSLIGKHYSPYDTTRYLLEAAPEEGLMYLLFDNDTPIGVMCFSQAWPIHLGCSCAVEDLLYIHPKHRSYKAALFFIKSVTQELRKEFKGTFLVFAGNTLGPAAVEELYLRAGFVRNGTHLVTEVEGLS